MAIIFTNRELIRASRELETASTANQATNRTNPHRLLLFYAVECGLKAVWMKRNNKTLFDTPEIQRIGHNLKDIIKELNIGSSLPLPDTIKLSSIKSSGVDVTRNGKFSDLHQAWRYGGKCEEPDDSDHEAQLNKVLVWIQGELK